jgi:hypothetical protein
MSGAGSLTDRGSRRRVFSAWRPFAVFNVVVLAFSIVYWLHWYVSPDYFIITSEYNITPIRELRHLLDSNEPLKQKEKTLGDGLSEVVEKLVHQKVSLDNEYDNVRERLKALQETIKHTVEDLKTSREKAVEDFKRRELSAIENELSPLAQSLSYAKQKLGGDCQSETAGTAEKIACLNLFLKVKEKEIALSDKTIEVLDKVAREYGEFGDRVLMEKYDNLFKEESRLRNNLIEIEKRRGEVRGDIYDALYISRDERLSRVGYIDLLYFSLGVSTASSFGDIIPNDTQVRMIVIGQVLISIIVLAWLVEVVIEP